MERIVEFEPAYDKRPKYGVHGVTLRMILKGEKGAVQFVLYTNWQLPHVAKEEKFTKQINDHLFCRPSPRDLGYHSPVPMHEGHKPVNENPCPYLDGKQRCYYDGSSLNAAYPYLKLLEEGSEGVWKLLEDFYKSRFEGDKEAGERVFSRCDWQEAQEMVR